MKLPPWFPYSLAERIAWAVAAIVAFGLYVHARETAAAARALWQQRESVYVARLDTLEHREAQQVVTVQHDTTRLRVLVERVDTLHETVLLHLTDTLKVKEFIALQDTTIRACKVALTDALSLCETRRLEVETWRTRFTDLEKSRKGSPWYIPRPGIGIAAGITPTQTFAVVAGLTLGWRF